MTGYSRGAWHFAPGAAALAGFSTGELIDFLGVSASSVLDRAGCSEEASQRVMEMVATISDEEIRRSGGDNDA